MGPTRRAFLQSIPISLYALTARDLVRRGALGRVTFCRSVHALDLVRAVFPDLAPVSAAPGLIRYPHFVVSCESGDTRRASIHGDRATLSLDRRGCRIHHPGQPPIEITGGLS